MWQFTDSTIFCWRPVPPSSSSASSPCGPAWTFLRYYRRVRATGAAVLSGALLLWGLHHLDYPFLRARGAWSPWGYYLDILFLFATGAGILLLVQDELRRGVAALSALSGDLQPRRDATDSLGTLLERPLGAPVGGRQRDDRSGRRRSAVSGRRGRVCRVGGRSRCLPVRPRRPSRPFGAGGPRSCATGRTRGRAAAASPMPPCCRCGAPAPPPARCSWWATPATHSRRLTRASCARSGSQIGAALENADLYRRLEARTAELARLSSGIVEQQEAERRRLSLELHDETAQVLAAVKLQLGLLAERLDPDLAERVARTVELIDTGMQSVRRVTEQLRPSLLDDLGLVPALRSLTESFAERSGIAVRLDAPAELPDLGRDTELALFRATQEALANVARHAAAHTVRVRLANGAGRITLEIADDGKGLPTGFDLARAELDGHLGLAGMRERIGALGGTADIAGAPGGGVRVRLDVPLDSPEVS